MLEIGDSVKRDLNETMCGTVISATAKYTLEPIAFRPVDPRTGDYDSIRFTDRPFSGLGAFSTNRTPDAGPFLLYDVPRSELEMDEAFVEGEYIIYRQKLGVIQEVERDAVLLLPNSRVVSPLDPSALELPVCVDPKSAFSLSELKHRDLGNGSYIWTSESEFVFPGKAILTETSNIDRGNIPADNQGSVVQAYVLATPAENIHIDWLCPNVFSTEPQRYGPDSEALRVSALQAQALKCDFGRSSSQGFPAAGCESLLDVGERVRFRDPGAAAAKYANYQHLPVHETFGYDINIFRIVSSKTNVVIQWQDGSCTTEAGTSLRLFDMSESELWPGKLVALKDGIKAVKKPVANRGPQPLLVHGRAKEVLRIPHVGIVQSVDSRERIASVRWYRDPDIELIYNGSALSPHSSMGRLSDTITDVSVYEIATFPALRKFLGDAVVIAPVSVEQPAISPSPTHEIPRVAGACHMHFLSPTTFSDISVYLRSMKSAMIASEWFKSTTTVRAPRLRRRYSVHSDDAVPPVDFFGKIVAMDTSGNITVRLPGISECRDVQISLERILMVMSLPDMVASMPDPSYSLISLTSPEKSDPRDEPWFPESSEQTGNEDLENNSFDDYWFTEDENDDSSNSREPSLASEKMSDSIKHGENEFMVSEVRFFGANRSCEPGPSSANELALATISSLPPIVRFTKPVSAPPGFAVLEDAPPSDHHFVGVIKSGSNGLRTKRIQKEFEILETSLPPGIFVRTWESRMDLLRVLLIGPEDTPYEHAPFVIDMHFSSDFPNRPPLAFFHSWTTGQGPVNPNLYEDGKICLSILGTWPTRNPNEAWSPGKSTVLQILVSIMGLVLVKTPFYNEAGYEALAAEDSRRVEASQYSERAFLMTRNFILHALNHGVSGLEDILAWNYLPASPSIRPQLLRRAIQGALAKIEHHNRTSSEQSDQGPSPSMPSSRLSLGAVAILKRHIADLETVESQIVTQSSSATA
ncbi:hypothetical protein BJX61DRAFT_484499 [Aspergillus egyptiacus]|nr:hypothetical protein BJX61DRAFT_484499 [Aspergillus egyptiacus]